MPSLFAIAAAFPSVVFTILIGVVIAYWMLVFLGALDIDLFHGGDGHDVDLDVGGDGGDLSTDGAHGHNVDGPEMGAGGEVPHGAASSLLAGFSLRRAPTTVVVSLLVTFSWFFSIVAAELLQTHAPALRGTLSGLAILIGSPLLALLPTAIVLRPLAPLFNIHRARSHQELVGHTCTVRTGTVDGKFGEGVVEDGGSVMILQIRNDAPGALKRGDSALLIAWDPNDESFLVEPMKAILEKGERLRVSEDEPVPADVQEADSLGKRTLS